QPGEREVERRGQAADHQPRRAGRDEREELADGADDEREGVQPPGAGRLTAPPRPVRPGLRAAADASGREVPGALARDGPGGAVAVPGAHVASSRRSWARCARSFARRVATSTGRPESSEEPVWDAVLISMVASPSIRSIQPCRVSTVWMRPTGTSSHSRLNQPVRV